MALLGDALTVCDFFQLADMHGSGTGFRQDVQLQAGSFGEIYQRAAVDLPLLPCYL